MCDPGKAINRAITPPGTGGLEAAEMRARMAQDDMKASQGRIAAAAEAQASAAAQQTVVQQEAIAAASAAADRAMESQKDAVKRASAASVPYADSENAKRAAEARMRRLLIGGGAKGRGSKLLGAAPVGFSELMGL